MDPGLYKALKSGNTYTLKQILSKNPSLLTKLTPQGNTPLHIAVQFGHLNSVTEVYYMCRSLLIRPNLDGDNPLHIAARYGHFSVVKFLVKDALSTWRNIELGGHSDSSKFDVLRHGNGEHDTILHEAIRNGHAHIVELLLKIDPQLAYFENFAGESPLFLAAREGMVSIVNQLLALIPSLPHSGGLDGQTALHAAVMERHSDIIQVLLRAKSHLVTEVDHHNRTPLYYAASLGDIKTVKSLLELDISAAYISDKNGYSPLHIAAENGHTNVIQQIIHHCPDAGELVDLNGRSALHYAVLAGKANVVRYMLRTAEFEGLVNKSDTEKNTPLHLAAIERKTWILKYLMWDSRVNQRARNRNGQTVFDIEKSISESCENIARNFRLKLGLKPSSTTTNTRNYRQTGQTLLMMATLIATVTFTAAFTLPGGYNDHGEAILKSSKQLKFFIISDSIAMTCSITAACIIFWGAVGSNSDEVYVYFFASATLLTYIALITTSIAFTTGISAVFPDQRYVNIVATLVGYLFHISTFFLLLHLARILPFSEICHFLNFHCRKMKLKLNMNK